MVGSTDLTAARRAAEAAGDDDRLLALREAELAGRELPQIIDGVRRVTLWALDPISTTWLGWEIDGGHRMAVRCLHPAWRDDGVIRRRFARAADGPTSNVLRSPSWHPDGDWPHLRASCGPLALRELLPGEDPADSMFLHRALARGLAALQRLHAAGESVGPQLDRAVFFDSRGDLLLLRLDRFGGTRSATDDLGQLGAALSALDPQGETAIGRWLAEWNAAPPPTAADAAMLLQRRMGSELAAIRHRLHRQAGQRQARSAHAELQALVTRLESALPPPEGRHCLHITPSGDHTLLSSDGAQVRGGVASTPDDGELPVIHAPETGLVPVLTRPLLRAWARRAASVPREEAQRRLGADDERTAQLIRWLTSTSRLRSSRMLLERSRPALGHTLAVGGDPGR